ncbi:hypothetical protein L1887_35806 [Cichorium endivia]|nr:hypothetical protein L1887_35806 [Cichorium endivia]
MRTRNADNPKSPPAAKRTTPVRKSATKTPPAPPDASQQSPSEPKGTPKRASATRGKTVAANDATVITPETPVEATKAHDDTVKVTPETKSGTKKTVKRAVKRTVIKKKPKSGDEKTHPDLVTFEKDDSEVPTEKEILEVKVKDMEHTKQQESSSSDAKNSVKNEEHVDDVCSPLKDNEDTMEDVEKDTDVKPSIESSDVRDVTKAIDHQEPEVDKKENIETNETIDDKSIQEPEEEPEEEEEEPEEEEPEEEEEEHQEIIMEKETKVEIEEEPMECYEEEEPEEEEEHQEIIIQKETKVEIEEEEPMECYEDEVDNEKDTNEEIKGEEDPQERVCLSDEEKDNDNDIENDVHEEDEKVLQQQQQQEQQEHGELGLEEEEEECKVAVEERKRRKEFEIFVGGLDRDATEEEVKKAFQNVGEVVDIRMRKEVTSNKNKGYAFVRFADKDHVARALAEMKNPVIHGKRCGTAPSEDNDTLFLGNICNTWTKEAIRQKLKDYGVEGLEKITLVPDSQHEGISRGFAFLEFSGHPDAMLAYKRLQKPDAVFGHPERSVKVGFAEPLREPDPEVLKEIKCVFVDGLPPHWDEDIVREYLKEYGSIDKVMLARNMSTARRNDFGFIDFDTHEAALACIDGLNKRELGNEKIKVRARLSNPSPKTKTKTQAVKGGIAGGFRIPTSGRGFGRGSYPNNRMEFQRGGRSFYQHGQGQFGQTTRMGFTEDYPPPGGPHPPFRGRHNFGRGGRWNNFRGGPGPGPHQQSHGSMPPGYDYDRPMHHHHHHHNHHMRGQPFLPEEEFNRPPYGWRPYEDPYTHGDTSRGVKRPYYPEQDHEFMEHNRGRPRLDYHDPSNPAPGSRLRGGGSGMHPQDYYNNYDICL